MPNAANPPQSCIVLPGLKSDRPGAITAAGFHETPSGPAMHDSRVIDPAHHGTSPDKYMPLERDTGSTA